MPFSSNGKAPPPLLYLLVVDLNLFELQRMMDKQSEAIMTSQKEFQSSRRQLADRTKCIYLSCNATCSLSQADG
jgi:hypothetical protein